MSIKEQSWLEEKEKFLELMHNAIKQAIKDSSYEHVKEFFKGDQFYLDIAKEAYQEILQEQEQAKHVC